MTKDEKKNPIPLYVRTHVCLCAPLQSIKMIEGTCTFYTYIFVYMIVIVCDGVTPPLIPICRCGVRCYYTE